MRSHTIIGHQVRAGPTAAVTIPCHLDPPAVAPGLSLAFQGHADAQLAPTTQPVPTPCDLQQPEHPPGEMGHKEGSALSPGRLSLVG